MRQRGDTIIEVVMAFAVFALLSVGAMTLMNRGTQSSQQALESTLTQQTVSGQAEALRYLRDSYIANPSSAAGTEFKSIITGTTYIESTPSPFGGNCVNSIPAKAFAINPSEDPIKKSPTVIASANTKPANDANAPAYPQIVTVAGVTKAYGVWIEAVQGTTDPGQPAFIDFHIRACWNSAAGSQAATTGTIVRLYMLNSDYVAIDNTPPSAATVDGCGATINIGQVCTAQWNDAFGESASKDVLLQYRKSGTSVWTNGPTKAASGGNTSAGSLTFTPTSTGVWEYQLVARDATSTVRDSGVKSVQVNNIVVTINGSDYIGCGNLGSGRVEAHNFNDSPGYSGPLLGYAPDNTTNSAWMCNKTGGVLPEIPSQSSVTTCTNYDVNFRLNDPDFPSTSQTYKVKIYYRDILCNGSAPAGTLWGPKTLSSSSAWTYSCYTGSIYRYGIYFYPNTTTTVTTPGYGNLQCLTPSTTDHSASTYLQGASDPSVRQFSLKRGDTFGFRWWNNHQISGIADQPHDPNFTIDKIVFERVGP